MNSKLKFAIATVFSVIFAVAILLFVLMISQSNHHTFDLTPNKRFSLAPQSVEAVRNLKEPVKAVVFLTESDFQQRALAKDLLENYKAEDSSKFSYTIVDPNVSPLEAKKYDVRMPGALVLESGSKLQHVTGVEEEEITNALLAMTEQASKTVYFLTGHGEFSNEEQEPNSSSQWRMALTKDGYVCKDINLSQTKSIPADASALVIMGPNSALTENEQTTVQDWLDRGGSLLMMLETETSNKYDWLLNKYYVTSPDQIILDQTAQMAGAEPVMSVGIIYSPHSTITRNFKVNTMFLLARPVVGKEEGNPQGVFVHNLVSTSENALSVAAADVMGKQLTPDKIVNHGCMSLGASVEVPALKDKQGKPLPAQEPKQKSPNEQVDIEEHGPSTRIIVMGDASFASNQMLDWAGNKDFSLNLVSWLTQSENKITIRPKDENFKPIMLTGRQDLIIKLLLIFAVPAVVFIFGLTNRRRG